MKEVAGDIWDFHNQGHWIVITTNGSVRKDGCAVMGRGVAKQAAERFPSLPREVGKRIQQGGNRMWLVAGTGIFIFPVKHNWWEKADLNLIEESAKELARISITEPVYMVRPGCGNGGLDWKDVRPILEKYLDDRFVVVEISEDKRQSP